MTHKVHRFRISRKGKTLSISSLGRSARGTPFIVATASGRANPKNKKERNSEMEKLFAEVDPRTSTK
jgi:hypothetical protein